MWRALVLQDALSHFCARQVKEAIPVPLTGLQSSVTQWRSSGQASPVPQLQQALSRCLPGQHQLSSSVWSHVSWLPHGRWPPQQPAGADQARLHPSPS